jgi:adenylylsulfate kinase-like enzyme
MNRIENKIVWLTGLSGSGKSTLANLLKKKLFILKKKVKILDGDFLRKKEKNFKFTKKSIYLNNLKVIKIVKEIYRKYNYTIVSVISPLSKPRAYAKNIFKKKYFEIFVHCKISSLVKRDVKGLYKKAQRGLIKNLIGYNSKVKYEKSSYKVISINTDKQNKKKSVEKILKKIL